MKPTCAPSAMAPRTTPAPMPREPPVTRIFLFSSRRMLRQRCLARHGMRRHIRWLRTAGQFVGRRNEADAPEIAQIRAEQLRVDRRARDAGILELALGLAAIVT